MKKLVVVLFIFFNTTSFGQSFIYSITLEVFRVEYTRIELFHETDSMAIVEVRYAPFIDTFVFDRPEADKSYFININQFNKVAGMISGLSLEELISGMTSSKSDYLQEHTGYRLTVKVTQEFIIFDIVEPGLWTVDRNLEKYQAICREMLLLARLKPKDME